MKDYRMEDAAAMRAFHTNHGSSVLTKILVSLTDEVYQECPLAIILVIALAGMQIGIYATNLFVGSSLPGLF